MSEEGAASTSSSLGSQETPAVDSSSLALSAAQGRRSSLRVGTAGMQTTVQDLGRFGYGRYGLPVAGALDDCALRWANLLVGNEPGAAALEITLLGPTLTLEGERPVVAA